MKLPVAVLPNRSVAVQLTVVIPIGKVSPEAGVQEVPTGPLGSVATMLYLSSDGLVASSVISAGRVSSGGVVSTW